MAMERIDRSVKGSVEKIITAGDFDREKGSEATPPQEALSEGAIVGWLITTGRIRKAIRTISGQIPKISFDDPKDAENILRELEEYLAAGDLKEVEFNLGRQVIEKAIGKKSGPHKVPPEDRSPEILQGLILTDKQRQTMLSLTATNQQRAKRRSLLFRETFNREYEKTDKDVWNGYFLRLKRKVASKKLGIFNASESQMVEPRYYLGSKEAEQVSEARLPVKGSKQKSPKEDSRDRWQRLSASLQSGEVIKGAYEQRLLLGVWDRRRSKAVSRSYLYKQIFGVKYTNQDEDKFYGVLSNVKRKIQPSDHTILSIKPDGSKYKEPHYYWRSAESKKKEPQLDEEELGILNAVVSILDGHDSIFFLDLQTKLREKGLYNSQRMGRLASSGQSIVHPYKSAEICTKLKSALRKLADESLDSRRESWDNVKLQTWKKLERLMREVYKVNSTGTLGKRISQAVLNSERQFSEGKPLPETMLV